MPFCFVNCSQMDHYNKMASNFMGIDFHSFCDWSSLHQKGENMACLLYSTDICRHPILDLLYIYFDIPYFCDAYLCVTHCKVECSLHTSSYMFDRGCEMDFRSVGWKRTAVIWLEKQSYHRHCILFITLVKSTGPSAWKAFICGLCILKHTLRWNTHFY